MADEADLACISGGPAPPRPAHGRGLIADGCGGYRGYRYQPAEWDLPMDSMSHLGTRGLAQRGPRWGRKARSTTGSPPRG